ncbi:MAG: hypothetical protein HKN87_18330 [Saprospiraceae bacterium]|nr:hypothetical protein [Saprospiraceae bacterium]
MAVKSQKRKKVKKKQRGKAPAQVSNVQSGAGKWGLSQPRWYLLGWSLGTLIFLAQFIGRFFEHPTLKTRFITGGLEYLRPLEVLVFVLIAAGFIYFSYQVLLQKSGDKRTNLIFTILISVGLVGLYTLGFNPQLLPNGDNAEYLMNAKSLVEYGGAYRLNMPSNTPNTLASLGLPLLLAPIYAIWGFDLVKMKILVVLLGLALFPLLIRLFSKKIDKAQAIILSTVVLVSPHLVSASSALMTETAYIFWSVLAILFIIQYADDAYKGWKLLVLLLLATLMTYLTRAIGITLFAAMMLYLFSRVKWLTFISGRDWKGLWTNRRFKKFIYIFLPLLVAGVAFQIRQQAIGVSQAKVFLADGLLERLLLNFDSSLRVIGQMLFSVDTFLWYIFFGDYQLVPLTFWWTPILLAILAGFLVYLWKVSIIAFYATISWITILFASRTPAEMVIMRYLTVLIPFLTFLVYEGSKYLLKGSAKGLNVEISKYFVRMSSLLILSYLLFSSFSSDIAVITMNRSGQGPAYEDYIEVAQWSKDNLPEDAFVAAVKPRIFWLFSDKHSIRSSSISEDYSEEFGAEKLAHFREIGVTHIVIDRISAASRENIYPIIEANQELFQTLYVATKSGTSAIFEIKYE